MELSLELIIAGATIGLGLITIANTMVSAHLRSRQNRRSRAADLYASFASPDHYRRVSLTFYRVKLKWNALPEPQRETYRKAVLTGWVERGLTQGDLLKAYVSPQSLEGDMQAHHFRETLDAGAFTEHEALTVYLYFWLTLHELLKSNLVDRKVTYRLFRTHFAYAGDFIKQLRDDIQPHFAEDQTPEWVDAIGAIDRFFASGGRKT